MSRSLGSIADSRHGIAIGGIMAEALAKAGLVESQATPAPGAPPAEDRRGRVMSDVRRWLARLVLGEKVPTRQISATLTQGQCSHIARTLRERGLTKATEGTNGGTRATPKLRAMARENISDEVLAALIWPSEAARADKVAAYEAEESAEREAEESAPEAVEEYEAEARSEAPQVLPSPAGRERPPKPKWGPVPRTKVARDALFLQHVRAWLGRIAAGEYAPISYLSNALSGPAMSQHGGRLCAAGIVDRTTGVYLATTTTHEAASAWSDEQLAAVLWPGRAADLAEPPPKLDDPADDQARVAEPDGLDERDAAPPPEDPLAAMLGQFLTILTRMDARFARLERELGLPPLEDDPKAKPVAP